MKILQICCFTNLWGPDNIVDSIDLKFKKDLFLYPPDYGKNFDMVCAAPPCTQFTKANSLRWKGYPEIDIKLAQHCFNICQSTAGIWFLENPPGRIERFIPQLTKYRVLTWSGNITNKEYVVYSNFVIMKMPVGRYGKKNIERSKLIRETWQNDFIECIKGSI